jgi:hypothetical protein
MFHDELYLWSIRSSLDFYQARSRWFYFYFILFKLKSWEFVLLFFLDMEFACGP